MQLKLVVYEMSAHFDLKQFFVADNESVTVELIDGGKLGKAYLQVNDALFAFIDGKLTIPAQLLGEHNSVELQERNGKGAVTRRISTDELYRLPIELDSVVGYDTGEKLAESVKALAQHVKELTELCERWAVKYQELTDKVNGKYSLLNIKGE